MRYEGVIFDLDGTVYRGGRALPGAVETLALLREAGCGVVFISNNPLVPAATYAERLTAMGIPAAEDDVLTSGGVTAWWVATELPGALVYLVGEPPLHEEFRRAGVRLVARGEAANVVVAAFDRTFDYAKWTAAFQALRAGARFVATNPDVTCPVEGGEIPDCGGIIAALESTTGRTVEMVVGKPSSVMIDFGLRRLGLGPSAVLLVGDRLETDIAMGSSAGLDTALVLTGVTRRGAAMSGAATPSYVLDGIADVPGLVLSEPAPTGGHT